MYVFVSPNLICTCFRILYSYWNKFARKYRPLEVIRIKHDLHFIKNSLQISFFFDKLDTQTLNLRFFFARKKFFSRGKGLDSNWMKKWENPVKLHAV